MLKLAPVTTRRPALHDKRMADVRRLRDAGAFGGQGRLKRFVSANEIPDLCQRRSIPKARSVD